MKAFTLIEVMVAAAIVFIIVALVLCVANSDNLDTQDTEFYLNPEAASAKAQARMADELAEQNRLIREQMRRQER